MVESIIVAQSANADVLAYLLVSTALRYEASVIAELAERGVVRETSRWTEWRYIASLLEDLVCRRG